jgi:hypothetical protein
VTNIGVKAFSGGSSLTNVTIPGGVTSIGDEAFADCPSLARVYFQGNAPSAGSSVFSGDDHATVYYLPGTTGWGPTFAGLPTALPARLTLTMLNGMAALVIEGTPGAEYGLDYATDLSTTNWSNLITLFLPSTPYTFIDATSLNAPLRFYRAVAQ